MTRNHFSKYGGPYFINNGVSKHTNDQDYVYVPRLFLARVLKNITKKLKKSWNFFKP